MTGVHEAFHVSILRKYTSDLAYVVDWGKIEVDTDGTFEEGPVCILLIVVIGSCDARP